MEKVCININNNIDVTKTDYSWQFGLGNDRAFQMLRKDVYEHVKLVHNELGFKYIRFHGIFNDDMIIEQRLSDCPGFNKLPASKNIIEESFREVANVYDNILEIGMKPFVELSFMPKAFSNNENAGMVTGANVSMPKDLDAWKEFIKRFATFLINRYGTEEIESWYFEVWNEPDLNGFFAGGMEDYFKLYKYTVEGLKEIDNKIRVGGPSTSACKWIDEFTSFCKDNNVPYDFVSTHHYPGDAFASQVTDNLIPELLRISDEDAKNRVETSYALSHLFYHPEIYKNWKKGILYELDKQVANKVKDKDLIISEFNSMAVFQAPVHDEKYSAAFVTKTIMDLNNEYKGYMFWCCSDVFAELFRFGKPFVGIFGIITSDGIPKPNFWAFKILSMLYPNRLKVNQVNKDVEYQVFKDDKNHYQVLVYTQDFDPNKNESYEVNINLDFKVSKLSKYVIDDTHANPKAEWIKLGSPDLLSKKQVADIKEKTRLKEENHPYDINENSTSLNIKIKTNEVILLNVEKGE